MSEPTFCVDCGAPAVREGLCAPHLAEYEANDERSRAMLRMLAANRRRFPDGDPFDLAVQRARQEGRL